jgi:hypothetical protein
MEWLFPANTACVAFSCKYMSKSEQTGEKMKKIYEIWENGLFIIYNCVIIHTDSVLENSEQKCWSSRPAEHRLAIYIPAN